MKLICSYTVFYYKSLFLYLFCADLPFITAKHILPACTYANPN